MMVAMAEAPTPLRVRAAAPDLARGFALLGIGIANSVLFLAGRPLGPSYRPLDGGPADRAADVAAALLVDNRCYPLFALLLGYAAAQLWARDPSGAEFKPDAARLLNRRAAALLVLGVAHGVLLYDGDILGEYAVLTYLLPYALAARGRTLVAVAAIGLLPLAGFGGFDGLAHGADGADPAAGAGSYPAATGLRAQQWLGVMALSPLLVLTFLPSALLGVLAARRRLLDDPAAHRRLLRAVAAGGIGLGVLGGVPLALTSARLVELPPDADFAVGMLHSLSGLAGAAGYAAAAGLLALRLNRPLRVVAAAGSVSLTVYLTQSAVFLLVFAPYLGGLATRAGTAQTALVAVGVWLVLLAPAAALRRAGWRGPAETLVRRWVYRPRRRTVQSTGGGGPSTELQGRDRNSVT